MFNPIKLYRQAQDNKLKLHMEMYSLEINKQFMLYDLNCDSYWEKDYTYKTTNYRFIHKEFDWTIDPVWIVVPKTIDNNMSLSAHSKLHHGMHPEDWIIKGAELNDYRSYPPERLRDGILQELRNSLKFKSRCDKVIENRINTKNIKPEEIYN